MTTIPTDALSSPLAPNRVFYSLGRLLAAEDFQADQDYHRGRLARALLQLFGTGTISGLNVTIPQHWSAGAPYVVSAFVFDASQNVQVNTGRPGVTGPTPPAFANTPGGTVADGDITWKNNGPLDADGWIPNTTFSFPTAIMDSNRNVQVLTGPGSLTTGTSAPDWSTGLGMTTADGGNPTAWTCCGPADLEIRVTPGLAIDRAGRMIEVSRNVCIRIEQWIATQSATDLAGALLAGNGKILLDVFATFMPCTRGVTPCFATQDDYDATDAFSPNRLLDSFAMQVVLRPETNPPTPVDPWESFGSVPAAGTAPDVTAIQQAILAGTIGGAPGVEYPSGFDQTAVFLARVTIPATPADGSDEPPKYDFAQAAIDNLARLFIYPPSLVAREIGLSPAGE